MESDQFKIYKIDSPNDNGISFKLCQVDFDKAETLKDEINTQLFNVIWMQKGSSNYQIDFNNYQISSESIFFLAPGQIFKVNSESVRKGYRLAFSQDFYCIETHAKETACNGILFNNIYETPFIVPGDSGPELKDILNKMFIEFENPGVASREMILAYLRLFLVYCTRIKAEKVNVSGIPGNHNISQKFSQLVEKNFRELHSVNEYADLLNISPKSLSKQLTKRSGVSPIELIRERIILEAKRELHYTDKSVKEIAYDLGFEDPAYFNRFFKKAAQITPRIFKKSNIY